ncbi:MAG: hypothetical protein MI924_32115 [Chloroflexales bacterium]|nr:hypothetical protein [Chloroflexales bacterium]
MAIYRLSAMFGLDTHVLRCTLMHEKDHPASIYRLLVYQLFACSPIGTFQRANVLT